MIEVGGGSGGLISEKMSVWNARNHSRKAAQSMIEPLSHKPEELLNEES